MKITSIGEQGYGIEPSVPSFLYSSSPDLPFFHQLTVSVLPSHLSLLYFQLRLLAPIFASLLSWIARLIASCHSYKRKTSSSNNITKVHPLLKIILDKKG